MWQILYWHTSLIYFYARVCACVCVCVCTFVETFVMKYDFLLHTFIYFHFHSGSFIRFAVFFFRFLTAFLYLIWFYINFLFTTVVVFSFSYFVRIRYSCRRTQSTALTAIQDNDCWKLSAPLVMCICDLLLCYIGRIFFWEANWWFHCRKYFCFILLQKKKII